VAPRYPEATHLAWSETGGRASLPVELVSLPSIALPRYPEVRLALPLPGPVHRLVERFRPDLIHCATEFSIGRMGQLAAARAQLPLVSSYHTDFARYADAYGKSWLRGTVSSYLTRFHRRSPRIYTPSTVSRDDLLRFQVSDVQVWGRGVDAQLFHPGRRSPEMRA
jgi:phosphatidylinositol alpha 1,6-mannosyltransferase